MTLQGRQSLSSSSSLNGCIVMCWYENLVTQTSHFAFSCHNCPAKQMGLSGSKSYKLPSDMTEEKTAKVKPFQVSFFFPCICVCARVCLSLSNLEKSARVTDDFKICSPNFTLFKKGLESLYSPTVTKQNKNKTKRLLSATGQYKLIQPLKGL